MFEAVKSMLDATEVKRSGVFLLSGTALTSASPLITHLMTTSLADNEPVCLVLLHNTFGHYCNISNKMGFNLRQYVEQGHLRIIEGLKLISDILTPDGVCTDSHPFSFIQKSQRYNLYNLYSHIRQIVMPWKEAGKKVHIIIENLTCFLSLGVNTEQIVSFAHYCRNLTRKNVPVAIDSGSLVVVATVDEDDYAAMQVTDFLKQMASIHIAVRGLHTGQAREVHGNLQLSYFDSKCPTQCLPTVLHMQYKMEEKNMKLFALGMSANTL